MDIEEAEKMWVEFVDWVMKYSDQDEAFFFDFLTGKGVANFWRGGIFAAFMAGYAKGKEVNNAGN
jgi:hypothetical protein